MVNPYELADELNACFTKADWEYVDDAVNMLRQQADRISELEKDLHMLQRHYDQLDHDVPSNEPVAWRSKDTDGYWNIYQAPVENAEPLYTHPAKTLTDEEITEVLNDENIAEYHQGNWLVLPYAFARAILRKAQEK